MEGISTSGKAPSAVLKPTDLSHPFKRRRLIVDRIISFGRSTRRHKPARNNPLFDLESLAVNHAFLLHKNGKFYLQKIGDNATYINDKKLLEKPEELYYGDTVQFGKSVIGDSGKPGCIQGVLKLYNSDGKRVKHRPRRSPRSETLMYESDIWKEEEKEKGSEISDDDESSQTMPHQENILKRKRSDSDASDDEENENESSNESDKVEERPKGECNFANLKPYGLMAECLKTYLMSHGEEKKPRTRSSRSNETILSDHSVDEDEENEDRSEDEEKKDSSEDEEKEDSSEDEEKEDSIKNSTDNESENDEDNSNGESNRGNLKPYMSDREEKKPRSRRSRSTESPLSDYSLKEDEKTEDSSEAEEKEDSSKNSTDNESDNDEDSSNGECNRANLKPYMADGAEEKPRSRRSRSTESTFSDYSLKEDEVNEDSSENSTDNESDNDEDNSNGECNRANLKPHMSDGKEEKPRSRSSRSTQKQDDSVSEDEENQNGSENATDDESDNNEENSNDKRHLKKYNRKDPSKKSEISALLKPGDPTSVYRVPEHSVQYTKRKRSSDSTLSSNLKKLHPEKRLKTSFSSTGSSRTHSDALLTKEDNTGCKIIDQITAIDKKHVEKYLKKDSQGKSEISPLLRGSTDSTLSSYLKKQHPEKSLKTSFSSTGSSRTHSDALLTKEDNTGCKIIDQITTKDKKPPQKHLKKDSRRKSEISPLLRGSSDSTLSSSMVIQRPKESQKNSSFSSIGASLTHPDALVTKEDKKPPKKYPKKDSRGKSETSLSRGSSNSTLSSSIVTELPKESQKKSFFSSSGASLTHSDALVTKEDDGANKIIHQIPIYDKKPPQKHLKKDSRRKSEISPLLRGSSDSTLSSSMVTQRPKESQKNSSFSSIGESLTHPDALVTKEDKKPPKKYPKKDSRGELETSLSRGSSNSTLSSSIVTELPKESQEKSFFSSIGASLTHSDALVTKEDDGANKIVNQIPTCDKKHVKKYRKKDSRKNSEIPPLLKDSSDSTLSSSIVTELPNKSQENSSFPSFGAALTHSDALVTNEDKKPAKKHLKKHSRRKSEISPLLRGSLDSPLSSSMVTQLPKESQKDPSFSSNGASLRHSDALVTKEDDGANKIIHQIPTYDKKPPHKHLKKDSRRKSEISPLLRGSSDSPLSSSMVTQLPKESQKDSSFSSNGASLRHSDALVTKEDNVAGKIIDQIPSNGKISDSNNASRKETLKLPSKKHVYKNVKDNDAANQDVSRISSHKTRKRFGNTKLHHTLIKNKISKNEVEGNQAVTPSCSHVAKSSDLRRESNNEIAHQDFLLEKLSYRKDVTVKVSSISETPPDTDASGNKFNKYIEKDNSDSNFLTENLTGDSIITDDASISSSEIKVLDNAYLSQASSMQETSEGGELTIVKVSSISETSPDTDASGNKFNKYIEKDNSDSNFLTENLTDDSFITDDASISSSEIKVLDNACLSQASSMQETSEGGELTIDEAVANLKIIASDNQDYYNHLCNLDTCFFASSHSQFYASVIKKLSLPGSSSKIVLLHESNEKINNPKYIDSALEKNSEEKVINEGSSSRNESSETENNHPTQIPPESHNLHPKNELTLPSEKLVMRKQFTDTLKKICDLAEIPKENFEIESCNIISEFESSALEALKTGSVKRDMLHTVLSMLDRIRSFQSFLKKI